MNFVIISSIDCQFWGDFSISDWRISRIFPRFWLTIFMIFHLIDGQIFWFVFRQTKEEYRNCISSINGFCDFLCVTNRRISWFRPHDRLLISVLSPATDWRILYFSGNGLTTFANFADEEKKIAETIPPWNRRICQKSPSADLQILWSFLLQT